jgi:hypothetical protein
MMANRPQADIEAAEFEDNQMTALAKRSRAGAEFVTAIRLARTARTDAGLDCDYDDNGGAKFTVQQGLKAACHAREDAAASLIIQLSVLQRLDRLNTFAKWIIALLIILVIRSFS